MGIIFTNLHKTSKCSLPLLRPLLLPSDGVRRRTQSCATPETSLAFPPSMLSATWATGSKSTTPRISHSSQTPGLALRLLTATSTPTMVPSLSTTQARDASTDLASESQETADATQMTRRLLELASASSNSSLSHTTTLPTTRSSTLITRTTL